MDIVLYTFSKRENSTARPSGGTTISGNVREPCSIISPQVGFVISNPAAYNYAYIPLWGRYYFIKDWEYVAGLWYCYMEVDALASWRDYIGASTQYVLRSSEASDGAIMDMLYPAKADCVTRVDHTTIDGFGTWSYILGIIGNGQYGCVTFYSMTPAQFLTFATKLLGDPSIIGSDFGDFTLDFMKAQTNIAQYITYCKKFPFSSAGETSVSSVKVGWWDVPCSASIVYLNQFSFNFSITMPKHPDASRGKYLNNRPFSEYSIWAPCFGTIPIPTEPFIDSDTLYGYITCDVTTGTGTMEIANKSGLMQPAVGVNTTAAHPVYKTSGQMGIDVQIAQLASNNFAKTAAAVGMAASAATGNIAGTVSGIADIINYSMPQLVESGSTGSENEYSYPVKLYSKFLIPVDEDNDDRGRPLCKKVQLSTIPGYQLISDADISIPATADENKAIKDYMERGYFYE